MRRGQLVHVVGFPVCRAASVKRDSVPRGQALFGIASRFRACRRLTARCGRQGSRLFLSGGRLGFRRRLWRMTVGCRPPPGASPCGESGEHRKNEETLHTAPRIISFLSGPHALQCPRQPPPASRKPFEAPGLRGVRSAGRLPRATISAAAPSLRQSSAPRLESWPFRLLLRSLRAADALSAIRIRFWVL